MQHPQVNASVSSQVVLPDGVFRPRTPGAGELSRFSIRKHFPEFPNPGGGKPAMSFRLLVGKSFSLSCESSLNSTKKTIRRAVIGSLSVGRKVDPFIHDVNDRHWRQWTRARTPNTVNSHVFFSAGHGAKQSINGDYMSFLYCWPSSQLRTMRACLQSTRAILQ